MKNDKRSDYLTRDALMNLLSDEEIASVSNAETAAHLLDGEEYIDLEQLDKGVQRAFRTTMPMGRVLSRKAVHENTWNKIIAQLAASDHETPHLGT